MNNELDEVQRAASEQFSRQSERYGRGHILENVDDVRSTLGRIDLPACARVLDVAAGAGHTGLLLASLGHEVTLSDLTDAMLERVREAAAERGLAVQLRRHSAEEMPWPGGSFDLVTCRVAAHHFSSPERFVAEVSRVLAPGGWFLLIDGSVADDEPEAEAWLHEVEKLRDPSHHRFLTPREWEKLCAASGLEVRLAELHTRKQPDLEWYFETAATTPENRRLVRERIANAPASARRLLDLCEEEGRTVWWWQILTLLARKPAA